MKRDQQLVNAQTNVNRAVHTMNAMRSREDNDLGDPNEYILAQIDEAITALREARKGYKRKACEAAVKGTKPTITCKDTDDPEYWAARLNAADQKACESLIDAMLELSTRLACKAIPHPGVSDRITEAMDLYYERFGDCYIPF